MDAVWVTESGSRGGRRNCPCRILCIWLSSYGRHPIKRPEARRAPRARIRSGRSGAGRPDRCLPSGRGGGAQRTACSAGLRPARTGRSAPCWSAPSNQRRSRCWPKRFYRGEPELQRQRKDARTSSDGPKSCLHDGSSFRSLCKRPVTATQACFRTLAAGSCHWRTRTAQELSANRWPRHYLRRRILKMQCANSA